MSRPPKDDVQRLDGTEPVDLSPDERRLVEAYRTTDQQGKSEIIRGAQYRAETYPDRPRPTLRLITNPNGAPA